MPKNQKLSKKSTDALEYFDACAKDWGWQSDCGCGERVNESERDYNASLAALRRRIAHLEKLAKKPKHITVEVINEPLA